MSMLGGLFSGGTASQLRADCPALHSHLGLNTISPPADVLAIIDQMTSRELLKFDNMQSTQGMQALFRARSIHASVDAETSTVTLSLASAEDSRPRRRRSRHTNRCCRSAHITRRFTSRNRKTLSARSRRRCLRRRERRNCSRRCPSI